MGIDYWQKQDPKIPLFPDLLWSRPEHKNQAGKLLIVGGHIQSFAAVATAYSAATQAGIGVARVMLPDVLQKTLSSFFVGGEYLASTPSGSIARQALDQALYASNWADGVLLAGDFGRNSETAIFLEQFSAHYTGPLAVTKDALDYFTPSAESLINRENTLIVTAIAQLQKLAMSAHFPQAFKFHMDLLKLAETLHTFSEKYPINLVVKHADNILVAAGGNITSTKLEAEKPVWRVETAAKAITWWIQNPSQPLASITTALIDQNTAN